MEALSSYGKQADNKINIHLSVRMLHSLCSEGANKSSRQWLLKQTKALALIA